MTVKRKPLRRKKGTGTVIARGGIWVIRYWREGKVRQESTNLKATKSNRKAAEAVLDERTTLDRLLTRQEQLAVLIKEKEAIEAKIARLTEQATTRLTLGELADAYTASPRRKDHTAKRLQQYLDEINAFADWAGRDKAVADVSDQDAEGYAQSLSHLAGGTYNIKIRTLGAVWKALQKPHGLPSNPWSDIPTKRKEVNTKRTLTDEEITKILSLADGELRDLIIIGLRTGLRLGDACQLRWEAFQPDGTIEVPTTKTGVLVRIPSAGLLADLGRHETSGYIVPSMAERYQRNNSCVSKLVSYLFEKKAGMETRHQEKGWSRSRADVSYHSLRHTFVTRALEAGVPLSVVQAVVGHASQQMTEKYTHIGSEAVIAAFSKAGL